MKIGNRPEGGWECPSVVFNLTKNKMRKLVNDVNGIESWLDTFFEVVSALNYEQTKPESIQAKLVRETQERDGRFGIKNIAIHFTNQFEEEHEGVRWEYEEYTWLEQLDDFVAEKLGQNE